MKILITEKEGPFVDAKGYQHTDTGDTWHAYMPAEFWTQKARRLFRAALEAGILQPGEGDAYLAPAYGLEWALLAWWCKLASTYLGLDRRSTTNWEPFEKALDLKRRSLSRATGPLDLQFDKEGNLIDWRRDYTAPIDAFFDALEEEDKKEEMRLNNNLDSNI